MAAGFRQACAYSRLLTSVARAHGDGRGGVRRDADGFLLRVEISVGCAVNCNRTHYFPVGMTQAEHNGFRRGTCRRIDARFYDPVARVGGETIIDATEARRGVCHGDAHAVPEPVARDEGREPEIVAAFLNEHFTCLMQEVAGLVRLVPVS